MKTAKIILIIILFSALFLILFGDFWRDAGEQVGATVCKPRQGCTGLDTSGSTGVAQVSSGTWSIDNLLDVTAVTTSDMYISSRFTLGGGIVTSGTIFSASTTFKGDLTVKDTLFIDQSAGRIGIGTTTPSLLAKIDVIQGAKGQGVAARNQRGGTSMSLGTQDTTGILGFSSSDETDIKYGVYGFGAGNGGTKIGIYGHTYGSGTNWAGYFEGGNVYMENDVGIGTTTPRHKLDVYGDLAVGTSTAGYSGASSTPALYVDSGDGGRVGIGTTTLAGLLTVGTTTPSLVIQPDGDIGFDDNAMFFDAGNDRLGIGTATPSEKLEVSGNILLSGTLDTGQGATELHKMNQDVQSTDDVTFATIDTGYGANELYDMNQHVLTSSAVTFKDLTVTCGMQAATTTITATSTLASINADSGLFYVDAYADRVGIGTTTPSSLFSVGSGTGLQIDSSGDLIRIDGVKYDWPSSQGSAGTCLKNDGSGGLSWGTIAGGSNWGWYDSDTIRPTTTDGTIGIMVQASSTFIGDLNVKGNATTVGELVVGSDGSGQGGCFGMVANDGSTWIYFSFSPNGGIVTSTNASMCGSSTSTLLIGR